MTETRHGFVCANAGVDLSNVERGWAALLPIDSDRSARRIRDGLRARAGVEVGVIVSDTFGRTWRRGVTDVAIGSAGVAGVVDLRGTTDALGRELQVTEVCVADELAAAAELVMGKAAGVPVAVVRGVDPAWLRESSVRDGDRAARTTRIFSAERRSQAVAAWNQSRTAAVPSSSDVHGFQPRWMAARPGSRLLRCQLARPGGACSAGRRTFRRCWPWCA